MSNAYTTGPLELNKADIMSIIDEDSSSVSSGSHLDDVETGTSTSTHEASNGKQDDEQKIQLAKKETEAVFRLRLLVFLVLLMASIAVSVIVYYITAGAIDNQFDSDYAAAAEKVAEAFMSIADSNIGGLASLGVAMIAHGIDHPRKWPFVTLSSFQQRSSAARDQSGALDIELSPLVNDTQRAEWESFVNEETGWLEEGMKYQEATGTFEFLKSSNSTTMIKSRPPPAGIWYYDNQHAKVLDPGPGPYLPVWETSPIFTKGQRRNENLVRRTIKGAPFAAIESGQIIISEFVAAPPGRLDSEDEDTAFFALMLSTKRQEIVAYEGQPMSLISIPIFNNFEDDRKTAAVMAAWVDWSSYFESVLPQTVQGIQVVLSDSCGGLFTIVIQGEKVEFLGPGDLHNQGFNAKRLSAKFQKDQHVADGTKLGLSLHQRICQIGIDVYPSQAFYDSYKSNTPVVITISVAIVFIFTAFMFVVYDRLVERRQALVLQKALQSTAIVSSLFPENVRDRLLNNTGNTNNKGAQGKSTFETPVNRLKGYLGDGYGDETNDEPIADLFPHCTVMFADVAGFTAWSSTRDPAQVFVLLQTLYQAFDIIAKRRKVFKVETIGDSYVAVTGLPEPQPNHAVIMARFARDCVVKMKELMSDLESSLGPDTADLTIRIGMHSGPVTAGVLKGDRARFQLFGDTVNTAARMESTGIKEKIQISKETHEILVEAGKGHWTRPRADVVNAKGKGTLQTFWLNVYSKKASSTAGSSTTAGDPDFEHHPAPAAHKVRNGENSITNRHVRLDMERQDRLIDWMVDLMKEQIIKMISQRGSGESEYEPKLERKEGAISLDEVAEVIHLPRLCSSSGNGNDSSHGLDSEVQTQLRQYVAIIASTYHDNPFHNFEHACHVTMAVSKFIKRIINTTAEDAQNDNKSESSGSLYDYTYGIHSDPLTVLAILFSALVHDADHRGISNMQLGIEEPEMASFYQNKSIAEQNSLDIAWDLLMTSQFAALQRVMFTTASELQRFRQVVVNVVLATDIFDKEINETRKKRWNRAFSETSSHDAETNDLRATIVIEHIIQASDVAHTMQHWHVYRKWNRRLYLEMHAAFKAGRMGKDPSGFWYQGELGFFDNYIIPLAKKLKDCNVFGVSSDECLNYAIRNRAEWEVHGPELVAEMVQELQSVNKE